MKKPSTRRPGNNQGTGRQLLEVAGRVFAERGFDGATGKEICRKARANAAAINYHFGGMNGLYAAVLREAHSRLVNIDALSAAVAGEPNAKAKLQAVLHLLARAITAPAMSSWVLRVVGRELVAPTAIFKALDKDLRLPKARIVKALIGELTGLDTDNPTVAYACISVIAPCLMLLIADRDMIKRVFPDFGFSTDDAPALAEHMLRFTLAGLEAVAEHAQARPIVKRCLTQ